MNRRPAARHWPVRGFTLIEVMVALLVFSLGVLGMVGMQARAMQFGAQSEDRMRAALLADEIVASMWANQSTTPGSTTLAAWQARVKDSTGSGLLNGVGTVSSADTSGVVTITITWTSPSRNSTTASYMTQVAMP
ncbi:MAG TPA: type IV pilus modification protein PilV [Burkholderiaceae bacterium]